MKPVKFSLGALATCALLLSAVSCTDPNAKKGSTDTPKMTNSQPKPPTSVSGLPTLHIKAGVTDPLTDSKGTVWTGDTGFEGGTDIDRPDLAVTGTDRPEIYKAERYSMDSWSTKLPNGSYTLKLHFSEDYDGNTTADARQFTYEVKDGPAASGKSLKKVTDFSPWKAAGAQFKAYVETIPVTVTSGQLSITFTAQAENPQINAIEVIPK